MIKKYSVTDFLEVPNPSKTKYPTVSLKKLVSKQPIPFLTRVPTVKNIHIHSYTKIDNNV